MDQTSLSSCVETPRRTRRSSRCASARARRLRSSKRSRRYELVCCSELGHVWRLLTLDITVWGHFQPPVSEVEPASPTAPAPTRVRKLNWREMKKFLILNLPDGWETRFTEKGRPYFCNHANR